MTAPGKPVKGGLPREIDIVLAAFGLALVAPVLAVTALLIQWDSPGPALYRAHRIGRGGRQFTMFKLRTMADGVGGPVITRPNDPRITPVGAVLRRSKLDELPQLLNVLRGDMAIVGPRPEAPELIESPRHDFDAVLAVRPGIFGVSQLVFRDEQRLMESDAADIYRDWILPRKLELDRRYVSRRSLPLDIGILARSLVGLLGR